MCGLAGFSGVKSYAQRFALVKAMGVGIDSRGGHAAGFVSLTNHKSALAPIVSRRIGTWQSASVRFVRAAASGQVCMMHSRFATCGDRENVTHAHPFVIKRQGLDGKHRSVVYGAHNGVLTGTYTSAAANGRKHTVDSRELLELLADGNLAAINKLQGYGVVTWITPASGAVNMVRLSDSADLVVVALEGGGLAWASTVYILERALKSAGMVAAGTYETNTVGTVYSMTPSGVLATDVTNMRVEEDDWRSYYGASGSSYLMSNYSSRLTQSDHDYTDEDRAWDELIRAKEKADEIAGKGSPYWRPDGKMMRKDALATLQRTLLPPPRRKVSDITLDNMTDEELGYLSEEDWDDICARYGEGTVVVDVEALPMKSRVG